MSNKNVFIVLEGIDGSGKSTQAKLLAQQLEEKGHKVYLTFEPTNNYIGSIIRNILKGKQLADHRTIAALFAADRLDHILNEGYGILQKLKEGFTVISDRYYFSSYAYHGVHIDMDWVIELNKKAAELLRPNITIFIDVSPEVSMERIKMNREHIELFETLENLKQTKEKYITAFNKLSNHENVVTINGDEKLENIAEAIWQKVAPVL